MAESNNILAQFIESGVYVRDADSEFSLTKFKREFKCWADSNQRGDEANALMKKIKMAKVCCIIGNIPFKSIL